MILLDAGASKEAPFVLEADGSSDSPDEAQPYVYPPHLDGLRTHGDEVDVDSIVAVAELQWPTSAFVGVIGFILYKHRPRTTQALSACSPNIE